MNVVPGTLLQVTGNVELGDGVYKREGRIYASRVGAVKTTGNIVSVHSQNASTHALIPSIGQTILGTVTRLTSKYVGVDISVIESSTSTEKSTYLEEPFKGTLRSQDIWPADDKEAPQQINYSFRPGDLVRARIIGVGDASAGFLVSTSVDDELGVVFARCAATGEPLVPISWNEMLCPVSGIKEPRKAAKPRTKAE